MFDEKLVAALQKAFQDSVNSLRKNYNESFYYFAFVFDEGMHPYISAWSYEAYEKSLNDNEIDEEERKWWKWSYADSPYAVYGYDEYFGEVRNIIDERVSELSEDELYDVEWYTILSSMEEALKRLNEFDFFGTGDERKQVIVNVEQAPSDGKEYDSSIRLNPPSPLLREYLEMCEREDDLT